MRQFSVDRGYCRSFRAWNGVCFISGSFYLSQGDIFSVPIAVTAGASSFTSALHSMSPTPFSKYLVSFLGCDTESPCSWILSLWYATSTNLPLIVNSSHARGSNWSIYSTVLQTGTPPISGPSHFTLRGRSVFIAFNSSETQVTSTLQDLFPDNDVAVRGNRTPSSELDSNIYSLNYEWNWIV